MIDREKAENWNARQMAEGTLTVGDITELVRYYQSHEGLTVDGMAGTIETIPAIRAEYRGELALPVPRCWPLRALLNGRTPRATSGYRTKHRPDHDGVDIFYPWLPTDPPMPRGDGGRTSNDKWWIPDGTRAIAVAAGKVTHATWTRTGYHVRIALAGGYACGYMHLSSLLVAVGDDVVMGDPVGIVGDNPVDTDARHLHFECYDAHTGWRRLHPDTLLAGAQVLPYLRVSDHVQALKKRKDEPE